MEILRIKSLEYGYKFKCKYRGCVFYFTVTPESCCPPFYSKDSGLNVEIDKIGEKFNNIKELINETINDKIIKWMEHTQYDPHNDDN